MTHDLPSMLFSKGRTFPSNKSTQKALVPQEKNTTPRLVRFIGLASRRVSLHGNLMSLSSSTTLKSKQPITSLFSLKIGRI